MTSRRVAPIVLIGAVMGSIYGGVASVTEAAAVGCIGALGGADIEKVVAAVGETLREAGIVLGAG